MRLVGDVVILFGEKSIPTPLLQSTGGGGGFFWPVLHLEALDDFNALLATFKNIVPLTLHGKEGETTHLRATLKRFRRSNWASLGVRLVPERGSVTKVDLNTGTGMSFNKVVVTPDCLILELGNESLRLEIYYQEIPGELGELEPPGASLKPAG